MDKTQPAEKSRRRSIPTLKVHREMLDIGSSEATRGLLIEMLVSGQQGVVAAQRALEEVMKKHVIEGIIESANEHLAPERQTQSLVLHSADGRYKIATRRQVKRFFDDRSIQASALIQEVIDEHQLVELDGATGWDWWLDLLKSLFFNSHNKQQFKWTPELHLFLTMPDAKLPSAKLIQARNILNNALHTERGKWYHEFFEFDERTNEYKPLA